GPPTRPAPATRTPNSPANGPRYASRSREPPPRPDRTGSRTHGAGALGHRLRPFSGDFGRSGERDESELLQLVELMPGLDEPHGPGLELPSAMKRRICGSRERGLNPSWSGGFSRSW